MLARTNELVQICECERSSIYHFNLGGVLIVLVLGILLVLVVTTVMVIVMLVMVYEMSGSLKW